MSLITKKGFCFGFDPTACDACGGRCCTGDAGHVWVTEEEISAISEALALDSGVFSKDYLVQINGRRSLKELRIQGKLECILLDSETKRCTVYVVRPEQCRTYPFWECFKKTKRRPCASVLGFGLSKIHRQKNEERVCFF